MSIEATSELEMRFVEWDDFRHAFGKRVIVENGNRVRESTASCSA